MRKALIVSIGMLLLACSTGNDVGDEGVNSGGSDAGPDLNSDSSPGGPGGPGSSSSSGGPGASCGAASGTLCAEGDSCGNNADCSSNACSYNGKCMTRPSCVRHLGGDTCGKGEVGDDGAVHESCCESNEVVGFTDAAHPGKRAYLDKYEITAGRMRAFIEAMSARYNGNPDLKSYATSNTPRVWNNVWTSYLPNSFTDGVKRIDRMLLGDPRHLGQTQAEAGPGIILVPDQDKDVSLGINTQFSGQPYVELHGENCGTFKSSWGSPTYYFPADVQILQGEVPRVDAKGNHGEIIPAQEWLDVKAMNCASNSILQLFCEWDTNGEGELMTGEVFDFITQTPSRPIETGGCGTQYDNHGALLGEDTSSSSFKGGRCPDWFDAQGNPQINATFDAGGRLGPSFTNRQLYHYPDVDQGNVQNTDDKTWQVAPGGRIQTDFISLPGQSKGWYDLAGNLGEAVLDTKNGQFSGLFSIRGRALGTGSQHSDESVKLMPGESVRRIQRPEAKSYNIGGRCVRFK